MGKEPDLVREVEWYQLDIADLYTQHSLWDPTPEEGLDSLLFSGFVQGEIHQAGVGILTVPG